MKVYIAASMKMKAAALAFSHFLESNDHTVTSSWLRSEQEDGDIHNRTTAQNQSFAEPDIDDLRRADVLLLFDLGPMSKDRMIETGYALGSHYPVIRYTDSAPSAESVFWHLPAVINCESRNAVLAVLKALELMMRQPS